MIWIASFALVAAMLIAMRLTSRPGIAAPVLAMIAIAAGIETYTDSAVIGLRPSLDAPMIFSATELKADPNGHYFAEADINGTSVAVMVDTGATGVALSYDDAEKVGLHPHGLDFDTPIATANGVVKADRKSVV